MTNKDLLPAGGGYPLRVKFKKRTPDPGICAVKTINWEDRTMYVSNGRCGYFPSFDDVELIDAE